MSELTPMQGRAWSAYFDLSRELFTALERRVQAAGAVSVADLELLVPLRAADPGGLRAKELGERAGWETSRVSHQLRRMERRGLVARRPDPADGRGTLVALTPLGRAACDAAEPALHAGVCSLLLDHLDADELEVLERVARRSLAVLATEPSSGLLVDYPPA